jgi:hypothetical protein
MLHISEMKVIAGAQYMWYGAFPEEHHHLQSFVTAYRPAAERWTDDFLRRIK